ncbi:fumarate reductase flavoprotein subunit [Variovorax boronicumulans]|uniref:FAD-dependent oxidoreductase n=1 Tax=Variovorax boronicumulans TaxID=436515 RepID=UPI002789222C|nr:FAD-dependent oxidoreductase [Variovorax boronicumulans]MDP9994527.1 fumarate reductase flavoprotein subunit [Variovorax boronicumulans]MDQ0005774.1 fumarate reductase flavoprotein subunit [Variovorax boronicumulans]
MISEQVPPRTDVLVIGGGIAGHSAALAAAEGGAASVVLLEKTADFGGSSRQAVGGFAFAGTDLQREAGTSDSNEELRRDLLKSGEGNNDASLLELLLDRQLEAYAWLRQHGVEFAYSRPAAAGSGVHTHSNWGGQAVRALHKCVLSHPRICYVPGHAAERLVRGDEDRTSVVGVQLAASAGEPGLLHTGGGVVLATGGFSRSRQYMEAFAPQLLAAIPSGGSGNTGDGLRMATALGAGLADMGWVSGTFGAALPGYPDLTPREGEPPGLLFPIYSGAVAVNLHGKRFTDESASYKAIGKLCLEQPRGVAFQLFDSKTMALSRTAPAHNFRAALERGELRHSDTLADLATTLGVDAAELTRTIDRYNRDADAGVDSQFGRRITGKLDQAPFYAYPCGVAVTTTFCGLTIDTATRVLDVYGEPIAHLYAAGELVAGFHGSNYMSGSALTKSVVTGCIAGAHAAVASLTGATE